MEKRTIKPAAGTSRVSAATARDAARFVYRSSETGKLVVTKSNPTARRARALSSKHR